MVDPMLMRNFVEEAVRACHFFLNCRQWDGLTKSQVESWLSNFPGDSGRFYAYKLLFNLHYYSENDMEILLKEGLRVGILGESVLQELQVATRFDVDQHRLQEAYKLQLRETVFVPLLDRDHPSESGNQLSRMLVNGLGIPQNQVTQAFKLSPAKHDWVKRLVIVDDCIGSGDQLRDFWLEQKTADDYLLYQWCSIHGIKPYYLVLVGYDETIKQLSEELPDLTIYCSEVLSAKHRIFQKGSVYWADDTERREAQDYFRTLLQPYQVCLTGHKGLDFGVIMHKNIPDWSLPMLWSDGNGTWRILMQRKNSRAKSV